MIHRSDHHQTRSGCPTSSQSQAADVVVMSPEGSMLVQLPARSTTRTVGLVPRYAWIWATRISELPAASQSSSQPIRRCAKLASASPRPCSMPRDCPMSGSADAALTPWVAPSE